jgi:hypothetical protein
MSEVTAVNDQITDSVTQVKPSDVMYGKKEEAAAAPAAAEVKTEETKAPTDTNQEKSVEAKAQEESAKPKEEVKYDLKLPEGSLLTQAEVDKIVSFSKEQGLSQESAQKLVEREHSILANYQEQQEQQFEQMRETWFKQVESDKELGGENLKTTSELAKRALNKFAPDSLKKFFAESPYGNHPEILRMFSNIGKAMQDDKLVLAGTQSPPAFNPIDIMYDNSKGK